MRTIYNRVNIAQNKLLVLKSYLPGIITSMFPKKNYEGLFSEKAVNELHAWVENHPHVIHSPNVKDSFFVKINDTIVKKQKYILQILVQNLHNDVILPISDGSFFV